MNKCYFLITIFLLTILCHYHVNAQITEPLPIAQESEISIKNYTGIITDKYPNGRPSLWREVVEGKADGLWLEWYPSGVLRYKALWKNNLGHGKWEYYYPNGQLRSESFYINDIAQGLAKEYFENGQLQRDITYLNGQKDGWEVSYDVSGLIISRKRFENGKQVIDSPLVFQEGLISLVSGNEFGISFMPDGRTAYFTRRDLVSGEKRIYVTFLKEGIWTTPSIAPFSTHEDENAFITKDGKRLYFASYRPLPDGSTTEDADMNLWAMDRIDKGWTEPQPLSKIINKSKSPNDDWTQAYEAGPSVDKDGNLYFWTNAKEGKTTNLYRANLKADSTFDKPIELFPSSSNMHYDTAPMISPNGQFLIFSSDNRADGYGDSDLYYSSRTEEGWSEPKNFGPGINSAYSEGSPSFSPDGRYFFFSSNRGDIKDKDGERIWNLYYIESRFLPVRK